MKRTIIAGIAALAALTQACASDAPKNPEPAGLDTKEASIPFINEHDAILGWQANGEDGLWIQDARKQWYYAKMFGPCNGLDFAVQLGFKNRALNRLDRFSEVIVPDSGRCTLQSLKKSGEPPAQGKRHGKISAGDKAAADSKDGAAK